MVFLNVPYTGSSKIGGMDGFSDISDPMHGLGCHFSMGTKSPYIQGCRKVDFLVAKWPEMPVFYPKDWPEMSEITEK